MRLLFIFVIFFLLAQANAPRSFADSDFRYGIEGGINISNVVVQNHLITPRNRIGLLAGLYGEFFPSTSSRFSLLPGAYFLTKGYDVGSTSLFLNYIQIRTLMRFSFFQTLSSRFFIELGPSIDFIIKKELQTGASTSVATAYRDYDLSAMAGIGFEAQITSQSQIVVHGKYHRGLLNLLTDGSGTLNSHGVLLSVALQISTDAETTESTEERARQYINRHREKDEGNADKKEEGQEKAVSAPASPPENSPESESKTPEESLNSQPDAQQPNSEGEASTNSDPL